MGKLLFDLQPIVIDRSLAKVIGLNETIIVQQIHYWLEVNKKKGQNFYNNRYWTYNSIKEWHDNDFDFWSEKTVARAFSELESKGILVVSNFNEDRRDRTKWYSIDYERLEQIMYDVQMQKDKMTKCKQTNCPNANTQKDTMHMDKMTEPLPETSTETSSENNLSNQIEFETIDDMINYYSNKYKLPYEKILSVYDRVKEQYRAGNVTKFKEYFETALAKEKADYEVNKFIDL